MNGTLRLDVAVEVHRSRAVEERRVAYLLVERCLVVETRGEAERPLFRLGGQKAHRQARREERLFVPVPRREAQAVSQVEESRLRLEAPRVLRKGVPAVVGEVALGAQAVNKREHVLIVGQGIAHRIAHLPLAGIFLDALPLPFHAGLHGVPLETRAEFQSRVEHIGPQAVAGMLHISAHAEIVGRNGIFEPVFAADVVGFLFARGERRALQGEEGFRVEMMRERGRAEERSESVLLLAVEIDLERFGIFHRAELRFALLGHEVVAVVTNVAEHVERPPLVGPPREERLPVDKVRAVFGICVERAEQVARGLVAQRRHKAHVLIAPAHVAAGSERGSLHRGLKLLRTLVGDVQDRRHFVAVACLEAAGGEVDAFHHVGVDD